MAIFLVDYENVWATSGLKGVEYLTSQDTLYIFYSQCCYKIRADYMEAIERSGCEFYICKLVKTGKNALDFYIASQAGECFARTCEAQIAIISGDKGFTAVVDFYGIKEDAKGKLVVTAPNIENGILLLNAASDQDRREGLKQKAKMLDLGREHAKYAERIAFKKKFKDALKGSEYEFMTEKILDLMEDAKPLAKRELYTGSLHKFGRDNGRAIYHLLKDVV